MGYIKSVEVVSYEWSIDLILLTDLLDLPLAFWLSGVGQDYGFVSLEFCCAYCGAQGSGSTCIRNCPEHVIPSGRHGIVRTGTNGLDNLEEAFSKIFDDVDPLTITLITDEVRSIASSLNRTFETVWDPAVKIESMEAEKAAWAAMERFLLTFDAGVALS